MTSICSSNFQQQQQHYQNINMLLHHHQSLQQNHQQQQQLLGQQQHQLIAPKMPLGNSQLQNMLPSQSQSQSQLGPIMKKKFNYNTVPYGEQLPSVARRNARERNRVKQVNNGFVNLRQHLPQSVINSLSSGGRGASKKLSKVDTLRIAVEYIRGLQDMLDDGTGPRRPIYNSADESSNDSYNDFDNGSLEDDSSPQQQFLVGQLNSYHSASPTPSYSGSDVSGSGSNSNSNSHSGSGSGSMGYVKQELPEHDLKFESFDSFSDEQPDDEELLDYISSWQEQ